MKILAGILGIALVVTLVLLVRMRRRSEDVMPGKFPEQLVYVRSADDVVSAGVMFTAPRSAAKPVAILWVHGWGANFYLPGYVGIGRALAGRGFTTISVNTRMHDLGNVEKYDAGEKRVRGGGYWGVTSEDSRDIAAWVDYAAKMGFSRVALVGHSAGWASVVGYEANSGDGRVAGMVLASGMIGVGSRNDAGLVAQARKLVAAGSGEELLRLPNPNFPSYVSAATYLDGDGAPAADMDFTGTMPGSPVVRLKCPILAFFGTSGDIAGQKELDGFKNGMQRFPGAAHVETTMIVNGDHEYEGEEAQVAEKIARWLEADVVAR